MSLGKEALAALLRHHDDLYYNQDAPILSDAEYDEIKRQYVELYGEYDYVPGEASADSIKFEHPVPVTSLDKVQVTEVDKLKAHLERLWPVIIQPKMDGLTLVSYPDNDEVIMGTIDYKHVTRGNGTIGEIVTSKVYAGVDGIGTTGIIVHKAVRSEVVMLKQYFDPINKKRIAEGKEPFKNLRNAAAGMLRNKDVSKVEGLKAFAYNIISEEENFCTAEQQIEILKDWKWNTVDTYIPKTIDEAIEYITTYDEKYRDDLEYEIDGLVIKHNGNKKFGQTAHHPNNAIAVKFEAEGGWTTLNRVVWQVGRTGKIVPVAEFEPIEILNAEVSRATLHNYGIMKAMDLIGILHKGKGHNPLTKVYVIKANDVIPKIIKVEQPDVSDPNLYVDIINEPKCCPECKGEVEKFNDQLFCINPDCPAKLQGQIELLASRDALNIEGLSQMTIEKMIQYVKENKLDLFRPLDFTLPFWFTYEEILKLPGFAPVSAKKLYDNIQKAKDTELKRFIYASNIPLIGRSASEAMANTLLTIEALVEEIDDFEKTSQIQDFGPKMINSLKKYGQGHFSLLWDAGVRPRPVEKVVKKADVQLTIVITGAFDMPRKEIETMIKDAGHKTSGSVSKKTSYLLASPGEEGTNKYNKAKELNVPIINTLEELKELL